jgi:hypothetical protein
MPNTKKIVAGVLAVCALLGSLAFFGLTPFGKTVVQTAANFGSTIQDNTPWFINGYKVGPTSNALFTSGVLTIANGQDQAVWKNTTGQPVVIDTTHIVTNAIAANTDASSTFSFSVGATSTATLSEPRSISWITNASTSLSIANWIVATGTPVTDVTGTGLLFRMLTDNYTSHASTSCAYAANCGSQIVVPPNSYFFAKIDTLCAYAQGGISCELATSTNRGFTTVTVPFWYHYSSPN